MSEQPQSLNQAILEAMDRYAERACFRVKDGQHYQDIIYRQLQRVSFRLAAFFHRQGVSNGERIAIIAHNSLEWMAAHMACLFSGGVVVPLQPSLSPETLRFILQDCGASIVLVENLKQRQPIEQIWSDLPELKAIIIKNDVETSSTGIIPISGIVDNQLSFEEEKAVRDRAASIKPEALAAIFYTAGEAGRPKGAVFNQNQRLQTLQQMTEWFKLDDDDLAFTLLTWGHPASLNSALHYLLSGVANVLAEKSWNSARKYAANKPNCHLEYSLLYGTFSRHCLGFGGPIATNQPRSISLGRLQSQKNCGRQARRPLKNCVRNMSGLT